MKDVAIKWHKSQCYALSLNGGAPAIMYYAMFRYAEVKHQNEVLKRQKVDNCDDTVIVEEGTIEDTMSCQNSPARMADSTEEASSIVTSACVAYRSVAARNPSQESDSDDSVVYAMPFDT